MAAPAKEASLMAGVSANPVAPTTPATATAPEEVTANTNIHDKSVEVDEQDDTDSEYVRLCCLLAISARCGRAFSFTSAFE